METIRKGLGRHPHQDLRDANHLMRSVLSTDELKMTYAPAFKVWDHGEILDQGEEGACVGFSWAAWYNAKPLGHSRQLVNDDAFQWYYRARQIDPWPGEDYDGTAVRAGADVAIEKAYVNRYLWAGSLEEIEAWLLNRGPIVVGSNWYASMDYVDSDNFIRVDVRSGVRGGHAYLLLGKNKNGNYVFQNSWGTGYGANGLVRMRPQDFLNLIAYGDSEFCTALQVRV